jgi:PIN domain nuclease of toxin-antitoxin system
LAKLHRENGAERVEAALAEGPCWLTTVNACEILSKLYERGLPGELAEAVLNNVRLTILDFDLELARRAAFLRVATKPIGASLGDRACLAAAELAVQQQLTPTVYTAERAWAKLKWPFKVVVIR